MRRLSLLLACLPLAAFAQLPAQQQDPVLYPYKKPMPPAAIYESGNAGIPQSGLEQEKQLKSSRQRPKIGPTVITRPGGKGNPTVIYGPNGTTVCTDANGRTTVCY